MGIDLEKRKRGRRKLTRRSKPASQNIYLNLLHQLYGFLARRTNSKFNKVIAKRLVMSNNHRPVVSLTRVALSYNKRISQPTNNANNDNSQQFDAVKLKLEMNAILSKYVQDNKLNWTQISDLTLKNVVDLIVHKFPKMCKPDNKMIMLPAGDPDGWNAVKQKINSVGIDGKVIEENAQNGYPELGKWLQFQLVGGKDKRVASWFYVCFSTLNDC